MWRKLLLVVPAVVVAFALFEAFLQLADPFHYGVVEDSETFQRTVLRPYADRCRLVPNTTTTYMGKTVTINSEGLRNPEVSRQKAESGYRILVLGDSVAFGWGVDEQEAFPRCIEKKLNDAPQRPGQEARTHYEVINAAVPGYGLYQELKQLAEIGKRYEPDMVILTLINNDIPQHPPSNPLPLFLPPNLRCFRSLRFLEAIWLRLRVDRVESDYDPGAQVDPQGVKDVCAGIGFLKHECDKLGARFVVFDLTRSDAFGETCRTSGIGHVSFDIPLKEDSRYQVAPPVDFHPNAALHDLLASALVMALQDGLLK